VDRAGGSAVISVLVIVLVLGLLAALIAGVLLVRTRGADLLSWAVLALAFAVIVDRLNPSV